MKDLMYLKNVASLYMDIAKCTGCGMCREVCPHNVFVMNGKTAAIARRDACMECGACSRNCPAAAVSVKSGVGCAASMAAAWALSSALAMSMANARRLS